MSNIYNSKFVNAVRAILVVACAEGARITREELSERLSVDGIEASPNLLKVAIEEGAFNTKNQAWAVFAGRFGGVRELDLEATAQAHAAEQERQARIAAKTAKRLATMAANKAARTATVVSSVVEQASV